MKLKHLQSLLLIAVIFNFSCTAYKQVPYFQDLRRDTLVNEKINNFSPLTLQPGDLIGINVTSLNRDADLVYNYNLVPLSLPPQAGVPTTLPSALASDVVGWMIDKDGNIKMPNIGIVKVSGLTTKEVADQLEVKLQTYLSQPTVNVRMLNFKISVLGDVRNPGSFHIQNEKVSLTEALSYAGDLNTTGLRKNVLLVREINGVREYVTLDLTSKAIFTSPYFYLKNNDILYVVPNKARTLLDTDITTKVSVIISALSVLVLVLKR